MRALKPHIVIVALTTIAVVTAVYYFVIQA